MWYLKSVERILEKINRVITELHCMHKWIASSLVLVMAWSQIGFKPVSEPILTCQLDQWEHFSLKFKSKYKCFLSWQYIRNCLPTVHHFVPDSCFNPSGWVPWTFCLVFFVFAGYSKLSPATLTKITDSVDRTKWKHIPNTQSYSYIIILQEVAHPFTRNQTTEKGWNN